MGYYNYDNRGSGLGPLIPPRSLAPAPRPAAPGQESQDYWSSRNALAQIERAMEILDQQRQSPAVGGQGPVIVPPESSSLATSPGLNNILTAGLGLPSGATLIMVAGQYRVLWPLGDGLGTAWYDASPDQLSRILGSNYAGQVQQNYPTEAAFGARGGMIYWGNLAEIQITSEDPWQDLRNKIFATFGPVPGFDNPEIKQLAIQGYFERWSPNEFSVFYRQTEYYQSSTEAQRQWDTLGRADKEQYLIGTASDLLSRYRALWGVDPDGGINNAGLLSAAQDIASGVSTLEEWEYYTRLDAEQTMGTPAQIYYRTQIQLRGQETVDRENLAANVSAAWREWVGPGGVPDGFAQTWGDDLYMNRSSAADLEGYLKGVSSSRWIHKDPNVSWRDWAAPWMAEISSTLELNSIKADDSLLRQILDNGLGGQDAIRTIRSDGRFRQTVRMKDELQSAVSGLGRTFGFVA